MVLLVALGVAAGCALDEDARAGEAAAIEDETDSGPVEGSEPAEGPGLPAESGLGSVAELLAGPGGLREVSGRLNDVLDVRLSVLEVCGDDEACFVEHQRRAVPPEDVQALLEEYLDRVREMWQEAARVAADAPAEGAVAVEAAERWYESAVLAARTAMAAVNCLAAVESEQFSTWTQQCAYQRDLYAASVLDQNRLRQEFEEAYLVFIQSTHPGQPT